MFGAFDGTVSADDPPLSGRDSQRFSKSMAAIEAVTCIQIKHIGEKEFGPRLHATAHSACDPVGPGLLGVIMF